jgi:hypothetical protein
LLPLFHETSPINSPRPPLSFPHEILAFWAARLLQSLAGAPPLELGKSSNSSSPSPLFAPNHFLMLYWPSSPVFPFYRSPVRR